MYPVKNGFKHFTLKKPNDLLQCPLKWAPQRTQYELLRKAGVWCSFLSFMWSLGFSSARSDAFSTNPPLPATAFSVWKSEAYWISKTALSDRMRPTLSHGSGPKDESWAGDRRNAKTVEFIQLRAEVRHFKNHKVQENSCWSVRRICKSTLCFKPEESPNSGLKTQDQPRTSQLSSAEQSTAARFTDEKNPEVSSQVWSIKFNVSLVILKSSRNAQIYERLSTTFNPHFTFVFYI